MATTSKLLEIEQNNASIPFFPSYTWQYTSSDVLTLPARPVMLPSVLTFSWIQAFFNATELTSVPALVIWSGKYNESGTPIMNYVPFSWPGEKVNIKGCALYASGIDIRGNTITATPIGSTPSSDILQVVAYGGMY